MSLSERLSQKENQKENASSTATPPSEAGAPPATDNLAMAAGAALLPALVECSVEDTTAAAAAAAASFPAAAVGVMPSGGSGGAVFRGISPAPAVTRTAVAPGGTGRVPRLPPGLFLSLIHI